MSNTFRIPDLLKSVAAQMRTALHQNLIPHRGELGTGREEVIREFLRKHLPKRFGVSTGFVFDARGNVSRQVDVIIYNALICPVFEAVGGKKFFPCEAVVCAGEVKSTLNATRDVKKALENLRSVKMLDRSANGQNLSYPEGLPIDQQNDHLDQIFTFIFVTDQSAREETVRATIFEHLCLNERSMWPNTYFYFDHYLITYCCEGGICPNPMDAFGITCTQDLSGEEILLRFYGMLARAIEATSVSSFSYLDYLPGNEKWEADAHLFDHAQNYDELPEHMVNRPNPFDLNKL